MITIGELLAPNQAQVLRLKASFAYPGGGENQKQKGAIQGEGQS